MTAWACSRHWASSARSDDGTHAARPRGLHRFGKEGVVVELQKIREPGGGERMAALIPGAKLLMLEHMGHDRPEPLWPVMCDAVVENARRVTPG